VLAGELPTLDGLDRLPALDRAIDESLRMIPIVPFGARIAAERVQIGGIDLPRKGRFLVPFHVLHHDARIFPDPGRYDPDRWIDFEAPPFTYLPFSAGLHMCIGVNFAKLSMKMTLAMMLQRFRLRVIDGARIARRVTVTVAPRHGLPVELCPADAGWERRPVRNEIPDLVCLRDG